MRRLPAGLVGLALLAAPAVAACSSSSGEVTSPTSTTRPRADAPVTTVPGSPPLAVVLGDSNTFLAAPEIEGALADAGFTAIVRGISGSGLKDNPIDWLPAATVVAAARPAIVVVALGTNDALSSADVDAFPAHLEELLAALGPLPVVWVTHIEHAAQGREPADERAVNDAIRAAPSRHPNLTVLDLTPQIDATRALLDTDALHFSETGQDWFAEQIARAATTAVG